MIHTREQLIAELDRILSQYNTGLDEDIKPCAEEIADLISTLNDNDKEEWKNIP